MKHLISSLRKKNLGLTLVELMVTLSVLAILATIAVPSFNQTIASVRLSSASNDLSASLQQARADAIRLGRRVTVCATTDSTTCSQTATWAQGWISFMDNPGSTTPSIDSDETVTAVIQALPNGLTVTPTGGDSYISFSADGSARQLDSGASAFIATTIRICSTASGMTNDNRTRDVVLNRVGRIIIKKTTGIDSTCPAATRDTS
jgi:type IV fimbrial biogenesis protein FimT